MASPDVSRETVGPGTRLLNGATGVGVEISASDAGWLVALLDRMALERQNLTAIDDIDDGVDRHLIDSLVAVALPEVAQAERLVDIGSGGGMPGIPLARVRPTCSVTLVESERRKCEWLTRASAELPNVRVVADRTETLGTGEREAWDVATARAVAATPSLLELAAPLVRVGGALVAWRGPSDAEPTDGDHKAARMVGFRWDRAVASTPFPGAERWLCVWRKAEATPDRFPRRPGRATKRPIA